MEFDIDPDEPYGLIEGFPGPSAAELQEKLIDLDFFNRFDDDFDDEDIQ